MKILKSLISLLSLFSATTSFAQNLEQFFTENLSTNPCVGRSRLWLSCTDGVRDFDFSPRDERTLDNEILSHILNLSSPELKLDCRYTYDFEGNWCQVNGSFTLWFKDKTFIEATDITRSYWEE